MTDGPWTEERALDLLRTALKAPEATFRDGQWETIDSLVNRRERTLLVQRTGWGKSIVYFISARIFRDRGLGPTIIISPLLALMRNQIEAAGRIGVRAATVNSTNRDDWETVKRQMLADEVDVMLISPERLANDEFIQNMLLPIGQRMALLVVDEAHCISDWGHDFRPDYRRIVNVLRRMPSNMPVLGTTATANNRVIRDIIDQLGDIRVAPGAAAPGEPLPAKHTAPRPGSPPGLDRGHMPGCPAPVSYTPSRSGMPIRWRVASAKQHRCRCLLLRRGTPGFPRFPQLSGAPRRKAARQRPEGTRRHDCPRHGLR